MDEFAEAFAGRAIYSMRDLYSGYDQFQLAVESRDITTMRTPIGLVRMCTLPQGAKVVVHLGRRHKNHLRFYRVSVVQNMSIDLRRYQYYKHECSDQVHNKIKKNKKTQILMERNQSKGFVDLRV